MATKKHAVSQSSLLKSEMFKKGCLQNISAELLVRASNSRLSHCLGAFFDKDARERVEIDLAPRLTVARAMIIGLFDLRCSDCQGLDSLIGGLSCLHLRLFDFEN